MWTAIECAGHPRDMGLAQGAAVGDAIREAIRGKSLPTRRSRWPSLAGLTAGPLRGRGAGRELFRHFAHQAERLEGMAQAAAVPVDSLLDLHLRVREGGVEAGLASRRSTLRARGEDRGGLGRRTILERSLPSPVAGEAGWILRESRPAVGYASVEVALPWLIPALAGVNEAGLAVVAGPTLWGARGRSGAAPVLLLAQDCLQRFSDLEGALDWFRKRPVEGDQSFLLADASGAVASVVSSGRELKIQAGEGELYLEGGEPVSDSESREAAVELDEVVLDPVERELRLFADESSIRLRL